MLVTASPSTARNASSSYAACRMNWYVSQQWRAPLPVSLHGWNLSPFCQKSSPLWTKPKPKNVILRDRFIFQHIVNTLSIYSKLNGLLLGDGGSNTFLYADLTFLCTMPKSLYSKRRLKVPVLQLCICTYHVKSLPNINHLKSTCSFAALLLCLSFV